ncbi:MAG TPA: beta-ketoacyl-ACP synthase III [Bacteriovoracaceae bacterium]|nr:beta-ketoacyl-ACP synthase III [Bacteriovoracaceae bacterium]
MKFFNTKILGTGSFLPDKILTNHDIAKRVDTNHQWIVERTGIHERRISDPAKDETPSGMAAKATLKALEAANLTPNDIDLILFSATIPDMFFPNSGCMLQHKLGITNNCPALDINAACTGWVYALPMADAMIKTGLYKHILVVGSEMTSSFNNWDDRNTCILFGDGCGVAILGRASENEDSQFYSSVLVADSSKREHLILEAGGACKRITHDVLEKNEQWVRMTGQEIFKSAVKTMASLSEKVIKDSGKTMADVDWFIPHQANLRIIEAVGQRFNFPPEKVVVNVDRYANTSSATVPIAMDEFVREGKIKRGDNVLFAAFGAGLTAGAVFFKY